MYDMASTEWERLAQLVKERRVTLGMNTTKALAEATGLTARALGDLENARRSNYGEGTKVRVENALRWKPGSIAQILQGGDPIELAAPRFSDAPPTFTAPTPEELAEERRDVASATELKERLELMEERQESALRGLWLMSGRLASILVDPTAPEDLRKQADETLAPSMDLVVPLLGRVVEGLPYPHQVDIVAEVWRRENSVSTTHAEETEDEDTSTTAPAPDQEADGKAGDRGTPTTGAAQRRNKVTPLKSRNQGEDDQQRAATGRDLEADYTPDS